MISEEIKQLCKYFKISMTGFDWDSPKVNNLYVQIEIPEEKLKENIDFHIRMLSKDINSTNKAIDILHHLEDSILRGDKDNQFKKEDIENKIKYYSNILNDLEIKHQYYLILRYNPGILKLTNTMEILKNE